MKQKSNFESELKSCLIVFQLLGLHLFSIKGISKLRNNHQRGLTWVFFVYFVILMTFIVAVSVIAIEVGDPGNQTNQSIGSLIVILLDGVSSVLFYGQSAMFLLFSLMSANDQYKVFLNLNSINEEFYFRVNTKLDYSKFKRSFHVKNFAFIAIHTVGVILLAFSVSESYIRWICEASAFVVNRYILFLFIFYTELIYFNLKNLENCLKKSIDCHVSRNGSVFPVRTVLRPCDSENFNKQLTSMKIIHLSLHKTIKIVNKSFGKQISVYLLQQMFTLMSAGYRLFVGLVSIKIHVNNTQNLLEIIFCLAVLYITVRSSQKPARVVSQLRKFNFNFNRI